MISKFYKIGEKSLFLIVVILCIIQASYGLRCHKCLSLNCADHDPDCKQIRRSLEEQLQELYYFDKYLPSCPSPQDTSAWSLLKVNDNPCHEEYSNEATCSLGRIQIKSGDINQAGNLSHIRFTFATVLGCAKLDMLRRVRAEYYDTGQCYTVEHNETTPHVHREMEIEHCKDPVYQCYDSDYCLDTKLSVVKVWRDLYWEKHYSLFWVLGVLLIVLIVLTVTVSYGLLRPAPDSNPGDSSTTATATPSTSLEKSPSVSSTTPTSDTSISTVSSSVESNDREAYRRRMVQLFMEEIIFGIGMNDYSGGNRTSSSMSNRSSYNTPPSEPEIIDLQDMSEGTSPPLPPGLERMARVQLTAAYNQLQMGEFTSLELGNVLPRGRDRYRRSTEATTRF